MRRLCRLHRPHHHAHVVPVPEGWTDDETWAALLEGRPLPDGDPAYWAVFVCAGPLADCDLPDPDDDTA